MPHGFLQRRVPPSDAHGNTGAEPGPGPCLNESCGDEGSVDLDPGSHGAFDRLMVCRQPQHELPGGEGYLIELLPMTIQWLLEITRHSGAFP